VTVPVPGPATVTCTRTLAADIGVDAAGNARNGGYVLLNVTIPSLPPASRIVNHMCVNVALPAAAPLLGADPDANTANDCMDLGTGVDATATAADVKVLKRVVGIGDSAGNRQVAGLPVTWEIEVVNTGPLRGAERARHRQLRAGRRRRHRDAGGQRRHLRGHLRAAGRRRAAPGRSPAAA
jgi:hypothetical protein